jgi:hypothetical protein
MRFSLQDGDTKKNLGGDGADAGFYNFQQSSAIKNENAVKVEDRPAHNFFLGPSTRKLIGSAPCVYALTCGCCQNACQRLKMRRCR